MNGRIILLVLFYFFFFKRHEEKCEGGQGDAESGEGRLIDAVKYKHEHEIPEGDHRNGRNGSAGEYGETQDHLEYRVYEKKRLYGHYGADPPRHEPDPHIGVEEDVRSRVDESEADAEPQDEFRRDIFDVPVGFHNFFFYYIMVLRLRSFYVRIEL